MPWIFVNGEFLLVLMNTILASATREKTSQTLAPTLRTSITEFAQIRSSTEADVVHRRTAMLMSPQSPYTGPVSDPSFRKAAYDQVTISQVYEGIADSNAGQLTREAALAQLLSARFAHGQTPPKPNQTFPVDAASHWNPSGFAIQQGEVYSIQAQSGHNWSDGAIISDAAGYRPYYDAQAGCYAAFSQCVPSLRMGSRVGTANRMSLCCGIGNYVWKLQEARSGWERYMPMNEAEFSSTLFEARANFTFFATASGELVCFANDAFGQYYNNRGSINVTVTLLTWPPNLSFM